MNIVGHFLCRECLLLGMREGLKWERNLCINNVKKHFMLSHPRLGPNIATSDRFNKLQNTQKTQTTMVVCKHMANFLILYIIIYINTYLILGNFLFSFLRTTRKAMSIVLGLCWASPGCKQKLVNRCISLL